MYSRLFAPLSVVLLCSCVMQHEANVPVTTSPVSLSRAQVSVIKRDLIKTTKDAASEWFGKMSATTDGKYIYVCGIFNTHTSTGGDAGSGLYFGKLAKGDGVSYLFSPDIYLYSEIMSGSNGRTQDGIMRICSLHGISIQFPSQ